MQRCHVLKSSIVRQAKPNQSRCKPVLTFVVFAIEHPRYEFPFVNLKMFNWKVQVYDLNKTYQNQVSKSK